MTTSLIDADTDFGGKVADRLERAAVVWLTTVNRSGTPQPNPVWFIWADGAFLIFTQPGTPKLRNIAANPQVSLNLNTTPAGGDVVVFNGTARVDESDVPAAELDAFVEKYADGLNDLGMTRAEFFADYSVRVRVAPDRLRGF